MSRKSYSLNTSDIYARRVITYADYMISEMDKGNTPSVRDVSKHFANSKDSDLAKSHVTIYKSLVELLPGLEPIKWVTIRTLLDKNKAKSIESPKIRVRIFKVVRLFLNGFTIEEIVEELNKQIENEEDKITYDTISRDLSVRFPTLAEKENLHELLKSVENKLRENSLENLNNQKGNGPNEKVSLQQRDEQGRFCISTKVK